MSVLYYIRLAGPHLKMQAGFGMIYCRITVKGKRIAFSTGVKLRPEEWDAKSQTVKIAGHYNNRLTNIKARLETIYSQMLLAGIPATAEDVKRCFITGTVGAKPAPTFLECVEIMVAGYEKMLGNGVKKTTLKNIRSRSRNLKILVKEFYGQRDLQLRDIKPVIGTDALHFFKGVKRYSHNHTLKIIGIIKRVLQYAYESEYISRNPLATFRARNEKATEIVHLEEHELLKLKEYTFASDRLARVRDCFVFACYTGLAYTDLFNLQPSHFKQDASGRQWIIIDRQKSGVTSYIPLFPGALQILEKYRLDLECMNHGQMLPVISNQKYNAFLKEIAAILGFKQKLTTHVGRKTFAMLLVNNGMAIESVSAILGHTSIKMTQNHYARVKQTKVATDFDKFLSGDNLLTA